MSKEPNQAIYDEMFKQSLALGYSTYNYLPDDASYPFVYFGEQFGEPIEVKSLVHQIGTSILTIHLYSAKNNRKQITDMMAALTDKAKRLDTADVYRVGFASSKPQIILDNSSADVLWHGTLELELQYAN